MTSMRLITEAYHESMTRLPAQGQHIVGFQEEDQIVVYQAYKKSIAQFAVEHQYLGGPDFSYGRMSWIKPNFLWMMYRCGWAEKENQEHVLALWLPKSAFERILSLAVFSRFESNRYASREEWKQELASKEVRLQWDPDHDPLGGKLDRRAIQLGLKGDVLEEFGKKDVTYIKDITDLVREQKKNVDSQQLEKLMVPRETIYELANAELKTHIGLD